MNEVYLYSFASVFVVSLLSMVGVFTLSLQTHIIKKYISIFISLAVGALLGDAFIHLIPEAFAESPNTTITALLIISGIFIFFVLEKFLHWHHHEDDTDEHHIHPVGKLVLFSDGIHNFIDGIVIGASFLISIPVGIATTIAVILHEIPQEIGDFAVLIHSGYTKSRALWLNFLSALTSLFGLLFVFTIGDLSLKFIEIILPVAAGGFIYIAVGDLIPEIQKTKGGKYFILQVVMLLVGIGAMVALTLLE
ncbi:MAG: ZIP family metal transporter [Patescibacteria group bacterium]